MTKRKLSDAGLGGHDGPSSARDRGPGVSWMTKRMNNGNIGTHQDSFYAEFYEEPPRRNSWRGRKMSELLDFILQHEESFQK
jgi:hypothetical protein